MNSVSNEWFSIDNINQLDSPALVVYPDRVKENIRMLVSMIDDVHRLRPHVKTNKSKEACQLMMEAGISKFKCATIAEAEMLALCTAKEVLLAYQPVGPKLQRFAALIKAYPRTVFSCLIDQADTAKKIAAFFESINIRVPVYIDLNVGMNRTGISPANEAIQLYNDCTHARGIEPVGLHVYDGHIHQSDLEGRRSECDAAFEMVEEVKAALIEKMLPEPIIIAGGTPTFPIHCKRKSIECSPGTFIYWDKGYQDIFREQCFLPAALVISRVVSLPDTNRICLDLGHKSVASENELTEEFTF